jgi:hypothetical protein
MFFLVGSLYSSQIEWNCGKAPMRAWFQSVKHAPPPAAAGRPHPRREQPHSWPAAVAVVPRERLERSGGHHGEARLFIVSQRPLAPVWIRSDHSRQEGSFPNWCLPPELKQELELQELA